MGKKKASKRKQSRNGHRKWQTGKKEIHNIFDSALQTIVEYIPEQVIPLVNEVFGHHFERKEPVRALKNEHVTWSGRIVTDLLFEISGYLFHMECQSTEDRRMTIRIMEYDMAIAIANAEEAADGSFRMRFPNSCVIYLRSTKNTPDELTMQVEFPGGESVAVHVPLVKVKNYTKEALFEKKLLLLLPYYLMRYEDACRAMDQAEASEAAGGDEEKAAKAREAAEQGMNVFYEECEDILRRLSEVCGEDQEQYLYQTLADLIIEIAVYLAPKKEKERTRAMRGTVIKTRAQIIEEKGIKKGISQGVGFGELKKLVDQVCRKIAKGKAPEVIAEELEEEPEMILHIYDTALKYAPDYNTDAILEDVLQEKPLMVIH